MILAKEYINFLIDNDLTQRQFLFLYLILFKEDNLLLKYKKKFKVYEDKPANKQPFLSLIEFKDLIEKGFIETKNENDYEITNKFKRAFGLKNVMFSELLRVYPTYIYAENKRFPTTNLDIEKYSEFYFKAIFGSVKRHEEILHLINVAKSRNGINLKLENFLKSHYWNTLEKEYSIIVEDENSPKVNTVNLTIKDDEY